MCKLSNNIRGNVRNGFSKDIFEIQIVETERLHDRLLENIETH